MNKLIVVIILFISNLPFNTWACSCIGERTVKEEMRKSDIVLTGKVLSKNIFTITDNALPNGIVLKKIEYTVLITRLYKGEIKGDTIKIITENGGGDCGYEFVLGFEYIIYSTYSDKYFEAGEKVNRFYQTDICTRTRRIDKKELRKLKKCSNQNATH